MNSSFTPNRTSDWKFAVVWEGESGAGLGDDGRMEERLRVAVGGARAVDLRRHDRVRDVQVFVAGVLVEARDVVAEARAAAVEEMPPGGKGREHARDVVGRPAHEPVRGLGPEAMDAPPRAEVVGRSRRQPHVGVPRAGDGIGVGQRWVVLGRLGTVVDLGDATDRLDERRMLGDIVDPLAVEEHRASVSKARDVRVPTPHRPPTLPQAANNDKPRAPVIMSGPVRRPPLVVVLVAVVVIALGETAGAAMSRLRPQIERYAAARVAANAGAHGLSGSAEYDADAPAP